jgi:hypothetical protein
MDQIQKINNQRNGRVVSVPTRSLIASGVSSNEIAFRLQRVQDATIIRPAATGRFQLTRNHPHLSVSTDIAFSNQDLVINTQASSLRDGRRSFLKKSFFLLCWLILLGAFLNFTGASQSLTQEWARRQGGTNISIVARMAKTGRRLTPQGFTQAEKPRGLVDLLLADPALLASMFTSIAIIGGLSAAATRMLPERAWGILGSPLGIAKIEELQKSASEFQEEVIACLKRSR